MFSVSRGGKKNYVSKGVLKVSNSTNQHTIEDPKKKSFQDNYSRGERYEREIMKSKGKMTLKDELNMALGHKLKNGFELVQIHGPPIQNTE